ncbi:MAG TPA: hypothetical protein VGJ31_04735, partial [Dongiaceae bacterium]
MLASSHSTEPGQVLNRSSQENLGAQLESVVETAEDNAVLGQALLRARGRLCGDLQAAVGGLIAARQTQNRFRKTAIAAGWCHDRIGNRIVNEGRTRGSGITEPGYLDWCRAQRQDIGTRPFCITLQVDEDVHTIIIYLSGGVGDRHRPKVGEPVEGGDNPAAQGAVVAPTDVIADCFHRAAVVLLDHLDEQLDGCMVAVVGRQITDPQARGIAARAGELGTQGSHLFLTLCREGACCLA